MRAVGFHCKVGTHDVAELVVFQLERLVLLYSDTFGYQRVVERLAYGTRLDRFSVEAALQKLWGHMFEVYTVDLLAKFYPKLSGIFWPDVAYNSGQIPSAGTRPISEYIR
jgi:hypothetical protein